MAYENDVLTRNEESELAVRVVTATEGTNNSSYDDVFTRDSNGKLAVRVVGAGGGDSHNLGFYATQAALEEAYPTAEEGDYAIVGETDTVWVWDTDNSEWVDTGTKGLVQSVNGQTGTVVLSAADVGAIPQLSTMPAASASNVGNIVQFKGTTTGTYTNGYFYKSVAGEQSISSGTATVTQFDGGDDDVDLPAPTFTFNVNTFDSFATNLGYGEITDTTLEIDIGDNESNFIVDVHYNNGDESFTTQTATQSMSDLESTLASFGVSVDLTGFTWVTVAYLELPTETEYVWERVDVQPSGLPDQTGQSGKFLYTNGTAASWSDKPLVNTATGTDSLTILGTPATSNSGAINIGSGSSATGDGIAIGKNSTSGKIAIGVNANCGANGYMAIGTDAEAGTFGTAIGGNSKATGNTALAIGQGARATAGASLAIGYASKSSANYAIQIGGSGVTNNEANTIKIGLGGFPAQNYKLLDSDGTIPSDRLVHAINKYSTMPTAASTNEGWIVQFIGTTDSTYTHGYIYECVSDGGNPATYSWSAINVQAGGGSSLPSQTGNSGKFLTTDGTDASWAAINALTNATSSNGSISIGGGSYWSMAGTNVGISSQINGGDGTAIGYLSKAGVSGTAVGSMANAAANRSIQLGRDGTNNDANTFKVANQNGNFEIMSADGTIPTDRYTTTPSADGTYVPTLTISSGVATRTWAAPSGGGGSATATTATLAANAWSSNSQTVNVTGVTASNNVIVSAAPASQSDYTSAGVICSAQGAGTLTFTCTSTPSSALTVNVLII